jgi:hypothetical protein
VVAKVASVGPANYPITKTNYNQWALLMRIKLEVRGLWGAVDPGGADFQVDRMALDAIYSVVPPDDHCPHNQGHRVGSLGEHQDNAHW